MEVLLRPRAAKYLERQPEPNKGQIKNGLSALSKDPPGGDIKPLSGQPGRWRLRTGAFRVLFRIENNTVIVTNIDPRGQAYKKKNRRKK